MQKHCSFLLLASVLLLISLGLVMLFSVGAFAPANRGDAAYFVTRQSIFLAMGVVLCFAMQRWDYHHWMKFAWMALIVGGVLMLACFLPVIGKGKINGAYRWLNLGPVSMQPIEIVKLSYIATLAWWLDRHQKEIGKFQKGFMIPMMILGGAAFLCVLQKDLGTAVLMIAITFFVLFVAGARWRYIAPLPVLGTLGILVLAMADPQKRDRLFAFMDPEKHAQGAGWQLLNALIAFGSGGLSGRGLGESVQKMYYLPEAHTDFIFPIIGEELGLVFTLGVVFCFLLLVMSGGYISLHAPDIKGVLLGMGLTSLIALQAAMNIAVVTGMIPTKGIGLPFISYGGSNLLMCLGIIGILLNIHRQAVYEVPKTRGVLPPLMKARM